MDRTGSFVALFRARASTESAQTRYFALQAPAQAILHAVIVRVVYVLPATGMFVAHVAGELAC
jgi:hypothetical protein